jgi:hypothetical protein
MRRAAAKAVRGRPGYGRTGRERRNQETYKTHDDHFHDVLVLLT